MPKGSGGSQKNVKAGTLLKLVLICNNYKDAIVNKRYVKQISMNKTPYQAKSGHFVVQAIKTIIGKLRQNPDVYPIRYYKKSRRLSNGYNRQMVK